MSGDSPLGTCIAFGGRGRRVFWMSACLAALLTPIVSQAQNPRQSGATGANAGGAVATIAKPQVPLAPDTGRLPADKRYLPGSINEPLMSMTIQVVQETGATNVYRSKHFEFTSPVKLRTNAMTQICRTFESTYELVSKLPWGITPWPEDGRIFHAQFYESRDAYLHSGAPEWSSGIYSMKDAVFRIPFEEVGLRSRGSEFFLGGPINNEVITHEVTHQMMHEYLRFMPIWMTEGFAEYTAHLPYDSGRYNVNGALEGFKKWREDSAKVKKNGLVTGTRRTGQWMGPRLWNYTTSITKARPITSLDFDPPKKADGFENSQPIHVGPPGFDSDIADLSNRYFSSYAMVFYFMHMDGDGKATRLKRYFDAIHEERKRWVGFNAALAQYDAEVVKYKEAIAKYLAEWEVFKKQPGVEDLGSGRYRYRADLKAPVEPQAPKLPPGPGNIDPTKVCVKHLQILLDGRTPEVLDAEVKAAFGKAQIPLEMNGR